jgi:hypothetical protein
MIDSHEEKTMAGWELALLVYGAASLTASLVVIRFGVRLARLRERDAEHVLLWNRSAEPA